MSLSFGLNPVLLAFCALVAAALAYWSYRRTVPALTPARRALLGGLRFVVLFLVLFLLFEPILRRVEQETRPPVLAVLVDDSQSLSLTAGEGDSVADDAGARIRSVLQRLPAGDADLPGGETRVFTFSAEARPLTSTRAWPDSLRFEGARTNIARALDQVREALRDENLRGVLLVSDGRYNAGRNPLYLAERYPVPIYTAVVGDTTARRDVQVRRVTTNEIAYVGAEQPVQVGLRVEDYAGAQVAVSLMQGGRVLSSTNVQLPPGTAEVEADLSYTPQQEGLQRFAVTVTRLDGEATYRNNTESFAVRVLRRKKHLLLLGAAPGPDFAAIRQILEQDAEAVVTPFVQKSAGAFYEGAMPARLDTFDAVVLAGYPGATADPAVVERVAQAAAAGAPLLFVLSRQTDVNLLGRVLGDVLPVVPEAVRTSFVEAAFIPTAVGASHPILQIPGATPPAWRRLPPLTYNESRWRASPDARLLATTEVRGVALNDPLLVIRSRGRNRSAALLGAGTWRWKNVPADLDAFAAFWPTLLGNTLQWITTREDDRPVRVRPVEAVFTGGEAVQFTGQVYDESLNPVDDALVEVDVTAPDGTRYPFRMQPVNNGRYVLEAGALPEGTYTYTATAERGSVALGADNGSFAVGDVTLEFKETRADAALMRQIAQRSGGTALPADELSTLSATLAGSGRFTPLVQNQTRETELRFLYGFLALIIGLLAFEWFLRKRSGLV